MAQAENPRAVIGDNDAPDFAKIETQRLVEENKGFTNTLDELVVDKEKILPTPCASDESALKAGALIKRFRDLGGRLEKVRVVEAEPHLRRWNAVNAFFNGLNKLIQPESKQERRTSPGHIDQLQKWIDTWQEAKEARERARLAEEAKERQRIADAARAEEDRKIREAAEAKRIADEAALAAERAKAPARIEEKTAAAVETGKVASVASAAATAATITATQAQEAATDARIATLVKPQDVVRVRGVTEDGSGVTLTKGKEPYAYVTDRSLLVKSAHLLFGYLNDNEVEKVVRAYARETSHNKPLEGAEIGWKSKGITR